MELEDMFSRAIKFARRMWNDKLLRDDPILSKLVTVRVIKGLTTWFFSSINKGLIANPVTEKAGLNLIKRSRHLSAKSETLKFKSMAVKQNAHMLEVSIQPWTGFTD